jgi:hypothetical protein
VRLLRDEGYGPEIGFPVAFAAGALLGAWAGTTVWRHVPWIIPAVAAAALAVFMVALRHYSWHRAPFIDVRGLIRVASATLGGTIGALLARRTQEPRRALVAALISISGVMLAGLMIGLIDALVGGVWGPGTAWLALFGVCPGAAIALWLCGRVLPKAFTWWTFALLASAFVVALADDPKYGPVAAFIAATVIAGIFALIASVPVRVMHRRRRAREELPTAQIVDRR